LTIEKVHCLHIEEHFFVGKGSMRAIMIIILGVGLRLNCFSQEPAHPDTTDYRIVKTDGTELIGRILKEDERELSIRVSDGRMIIIPQYVIKEIKPVKPGELSEKGVFVGEDRFATRYFITTNGLPLKKGEHYIQWNLFGPDFQFAVSDRFGLGIMTTWLALPIIGTAKYSIPLKQDFQFAVGTMVGTSSWITLLGSDANVGGALPFGTLSYGTRRANLAFSGGYGVIWAEGDSDGRALTSIAGMIKVSSRISLVFDSFIVIKGKTTRSTTTEWQSVYDPNTGTYQDQLVTVTTEDRKPGLGLFIPGVRWHQAEGKAFQFGFTGISFDGELLPIPMPMVQWYRSL
jgi:hypothetical protein